MFDKWFFLCLVTNCAALALNSWAAWHNRGGASWILFVNCASLAVAIIATVMFANTCYREIRSWRMMRRHYEAVLDDIEAVTAQVLDSPEGIDRDEFFRRISIAAERTNEHMRGIR